MRIEEIQQHVVKISEMSRRDDLMALFNILMYFMHGHLPWQNSSQKSLEKTLKVVQSLKIYYTPGLLHDCPEEIKAYYKYVEMLTFKQKPDYYYLRGLFHELATKNNITMDKDFDWTAERCGVERFKNESNSLITAPNTSDAANQRSIISLKRQTTQ